MPGRFEVCTRTVEDDGWGSLQPMDEAAVSSLSTEIREEHARRVINRNASPDIPMRQSVNPYRGCEHGCAYCFARPSHAYLGLSPGLDFETRLFAKTNAAEVLRAELAKPGYVPAPIALGINTDGWQPVERRYGISRACLEVLRDAHHPVSIVTKGSALRRDIDLLAALAREALVHVHISITTLDNRLSARLEPRAAAPQARLRLIAALREAEVPVGVLVAPVIPALTDEYLERILIAAHAAGAQAAGYVLLRLPHELKVLWRQWLQAHYPERAERVMHLLQQMHGGRDYDARFGLRQRGSGPLADLLAQRFAKTCARLGYSVLPPLRTDLFVPPRPLSPQGELF